MTSLTRRGKDEEEEEVAVVEGEEGGTGERGHGGGQTSLN